MCNFCDALGLECDMASVEDGVEDDLWCECGHLVINHEYLTLQEVEALVLGDIECGICFNCEKFGRTPDGGAVLTYMWVEFKAGQNCNTIDDILEKLETAPEDPCDTDFMKDISS